jgi:hypothetical protein
MYKPYIKIIAFICIVSVSLVLLINYESYAQPGIPMVNKNVENIVSYDLVQEIALKKAQQLWGQVAPGQPIPCCDDNGDLVTYMIPFCIGETEFPNYDDILNKVKKGRAEYNEITKRLIENQKNGFNPSIQKTFPGNEMTNISHGNSRALQISKVEEPGEITENELLAARTRAKEKKYGINKYGTIYVSARADRFPIPLRSHYLSPFYINYDLALKKAQDALGANDVQLSRYYFLGNGRGQHFEFVAGNQKILIEAYLLQVKSLEKVLDRSDKQVRSGSEIPAAVRIEWEKAPTAGVAADHIINYYELLPDIDWCRGCTPTATSMAIGFWDNWVGNLTWSGYGRLIDYWLDLTTYSNGTGDFVNVPNILDQLRIAMETNVDGVTSTNKISPGIEHVCNTTNGYSFTSSQHYNGTDWNWGFITSEVNDNRPFVWSIGITNEVGHSLCAWGYTDSKYVITYSTWGRGRDDWYYRRFDNGQYIDWTFVHTVLPGGSNYPNSLITSAPDGGEVLAPGDVFDIMWYQWGTEITRATIWLSLDGGADGSWSYIEYNTPSVEGWNSYAWTVPNTPTERARVVVTGYDASSNYISGDGCFQNFAIGESGPEWIRVTQPNGGEEWCIFDRYNIKWTSDKYIGRVMIEISTTGGSSWWDITEGDFTDNDGNYSYKHDNASTTCYYKVTSIENPSAKDRSNNLFTYKDCSAHISVTSPNGDENMECEWDITWNSSNTSGTVKIEYYCNGSWLPVTGSTPDDGNYHWTASSPTQCSNAKVRITDVSDPSLSDESDNYFSIDCGGDREITVTSPNGGENIGCDWNITWYSSNTSGTVKIEYYCNGSWFTLTGSTPDDGSYHWSVPDPTQCSNAKVRITDASDPSLYDQSDNNFYISCGGDCSVYAVDVSGTAGNTIIVNINIDNSPQVGALGFDFTFCSNKLTYVETQKGDLTNHFSFFQGNELSPGIIKVGGFDTNPIAVNQSGSIAKIVLMVNQCTLGETCNLCVTNLVDDLSGLTGCCGTFTCDDACLLGDVNMDDAITPGDALCAFQIYLNGGTPPAGDCDNECAIQAADINCTPNGVTPGDALYIFMAYLSGKTPPLDCDPSGLSREIAGLQLNLAQVNAGPGEEFTVPIEVNNPNGLKSFGFDLGYPNELLSFVKVTATNLTKEWRGLAGKENVPGTITIGGFNAEAINSTQPGALLAVTFMVQEGIEDFGDLWLFNLTDDVAGAESNSGMFSTVMNGVRFIGSGETPTTFALEQNYPNPFNMETEIVYQIPENVYVNLTIYNSLGHKIRTLVSRNQGAGHYAASWDGRDEQGQEITSGIYIYRLETSKFNDVKKMLLVK